MQVRTRLALVSLSSFRPSPRFKPWCIFKLNILFPVFPTWVRWKLASVPMRRALCFRIMRIMPSFTSPSSCYPLRPPDRFCAQGAQVSAPNLNFGLIFRKVSIYDSLCPRGRRGEAISGKVQGFCALGAGGGLV